MGGKGRRGRLVGLNGPDDDEDDTEREGHVLVPGLATRGKRREGGKRRKHGSQVRGRDKDTVMGSDGSITPMGVWVP